MNRNTLLIAVFLVVAGIAVYVFSRPPEIVVGSGEPLVAVTVPTLSEPQLEGKAKFEQYCAACHGENAAGQDGVAPPLVHRIYEPGHHADGAFYSAASIGSRAHHWPFGDMPPVEGISQDEVTQIITYVRALQRANGIE